MRAETSGPPKKPSMSPRRSKRRRRGRRGVAGGCPCRTRAARLPAGASPDAPEARDRAVVVAGLAVARERRDRAARRDEPQRAEALGDEPPPTRGHTATPHGQWRSPAASVDVRLSRPTARMRSPADDDGRAGRRVEQQPRRPREARGRARAAGEAAAVGADLAAAGERDRAVGATRRSRWPSASHTRAPSGASTIPRIAANGASAALPSASPGAPEPATVATTRARRRGGGRLAVRGRGRRVGRAAAAAAQRRVRPSGGSAAGCAAQPLARADVPVISRARAPTGRREPVARRTARRPSPLARRPRPRLRGGRRRGRLARPPPPPRALRWIGAAPPVAGGSGNGADSAAGTAPRLAASLLLPAGRRRGGGGGGGAAAGPRPLLRRNRRCRLPAGGGDRIVSSAPGAAVNSTSMSGVGPRRLGSGAGSARACRHPRSRRRCARTARGQTASRRRRRRRTTTPRRRRRRGRRRSRPSPCP